MIRRRVIGLSEDEETLLAQKDQDELRPQCNSVGKGSEAGPKQVTALLEKCLPRLEMN